MIPNCRRTAYRSSNHISHDESSRSLRLCRMNAPNLTMSRVKALLSQTTLLEELEICHHPLTKHQASLISQGLRENGTVKVLKLHHNDLDHEQLGIICAALHHRAEKLKKLQLDDNKIGVTASRQLANYMSTAHPLERFSLSGNPLGDESIEILVKGIAKLSSSKQLDFARCRIGSTGAFILVEILRLLPSRPLVDLRQNHIGPSALERLRALAKANGNRLLLDGNHPID